MIGVHERFPDDPDVCAIRAESKMVLRPWKLWSASGLPAPETPEIVAVLEAGLFRWPDHPGLCHFYIHTMEASPTPERALPAADSLRGRHPVAGHLIHMPTHIDVRVGDYESVVRDNALAIECDRAYVAARGRDNFYSLYRVHNYHFLVYGAMFEGNSGLALRVAREMIDEIPRPMLESMPDFLEAFLTVPYHVLVRFGRWDEILTEPEPEPLFIATRAMRHYARGVAFAVRGDADAARAEQQAFETTRAEVPESRVLFNNPMSSILAIASAMLDGEIEFRVGDRERAFERLREAVALDDGLNYDEPWGWMQPTRHALGALLLENGDLEEARSVYEADLARHPHNGWSLHGLAECHERLGEPDDAAQVRDRFHEAWARADVELQSSCFCRRIDG